jgi:hypothetical protein
MHVGYCQLQCRGSSLRAPSRAEIAAAGKERKFIESFPNAFAGLPVLQSESAALTDALGRLLRTGDIFRRIMRAGAG